MRDSVVNIDNTDEIPERTFHRWKTAIQDLFEIDIHYDRADDSYYVENASGLADGGASSALVNQFAVSHQLKNSSQIRSQILFEEIPSGRRFLTTVVEAIRDRRRLELHYVKFNGSERTFLLDSYCLKVYRQRWYVIGRPDYDSRIKTYALDRIERMTLMDETFSLPSGFNASEIFDNIVGVSCFENKVERVVFKVYGLQADYISTLPLHHSQQIIDVGAGYVLFELNAVVNFELRQQLLSYGASVEVVEPKWFRQEMKEEVRRMREVYR